MKTVPKMVFLVAILAISIGIITHLYNNGRRNNEDVDLVRVGVILNLTGGLAQADEPKLRVLQSALAFLQETSSVDDPIHRLKFLVEDGRTDPKAGLDAFRKLYSQGIRIYITGTSFNAMSLFPLTEEAECLLFAVSGHPDFGKGGHFAFRVYPRVQTGASLMRQILASQGDPPLFIFHTDEPFGKSYADELKKIYTNVAAEEPFQITQTDFKNSIAKLQASRASRAVIIGFGLGEKNLIKQMFESNVLVPAIGSEVFYYACKDISQYADRKLAQSFFLQTTFLGPKLLKEILSDHHNPFIQYYAKQFGGDEPQLFGVFAADAIRLLQEALRKTKGRADTRALRDALRDLGEVDVFSGTGKMLPTLELDYELELFGLDPSGRPVFRDETITDTKGASND